MQGKEHLYFLVDEVNRSLYVDGGTVRTSSVPRPLLYTPDGWSQIAITNQRNAKYFALDRNFSIPVQFVEDGAFILKNTYYRNGIEAKVWLVILKQKIKIQRDANNEVVGYGYYYDSFYKGEIDFSNFVHEGAKVTCNIMEGGIPKFVKANENTKYEIEFEGPTDIVQLDGILLKQAAKFLVVDIALNEFNGNHSVPLTLIGQEGISLNIKDVERVKLAGNSGADQNRKLAEDGLWFYRASTSGQVTVSWNFRVTAQLAPGIPPNPAVQLFFVARVLRDDGSLVTATTLNQFNGPSNVYRKNFFSGTATISGLQPNTSVYPFMGINIIGGSGDQAVSFYYDSDGIFEITEADYRHPSSFIDTIRPLALYKKLVEKISNGAFQGESSLLASIPEIKITCGNAIRRLTGSKIVTSLSDFFTSINALGFDIGMGELNGKLHIERKEDFIDYNNPVELGEVKNLKISPARDYIYNTIKVGFPEQSYDDVNGKQEFNNTSLFTTPYTRVARELNLVSVYRADCYGIEFIRINLEGRSTTDNTSDNDVFFIHTDKLPLLHESGLFYYFKLNRQLNPFASGLLDTATVFNIFLSPKRCLERNGKFIRSCFYRLDTGKLTFQTTDKNAELKTSSPFVVEKADVTIGNLLPALFTPNTIEFETPAPVDLVEILEAAPIRAFSGTYQGVAFKGIPVKVGIRPGDFESQDYTLLSAPENDLDQFIKIFE